MQYRQIVEKFSGFFLAAGEGLASWLNSHLKYVTKDSWWQACVIEKLSDHQQSIVELIDAKTLNELDLSILLRVADRNWFAIGEKIFLRSFERGYIKDMVFVRNSWAHVSSSIPSVEQIIADIEKTILFLENFAPNHKQTVMDAKAVISALKKEGLSEQTASLPISQTVLVDPKQQSSELSLYSEIRIKATGEVGLITAIKNVGDKKQYEVFINGSKRSFFEASIESYVSNKTIITASLEDVLRALTAYQINKPTSDSLYSLNTARIDFVPYQFRPALKLIKSEVPRLLIADSVGVGKTIEAGLILKEMQARAPLDSVLIICPKQLVVERKWEDEMRRRFDEDFTAVDGETLKYIIKEAHRDGAWPDKYKRLIIPYSLLTAELLDGVTIGKKQTKGLKGLDPAPYFDMVIVDEAHHVRNTTTQAHKVVEYFCEHANAAVFLTATPIQLGNEDLYSLLHLLFPDTIIDKATFDSMAEPNKAINAALRYLRVDGHESDALAALREAAATDWGSTVIASNPTYKKVVETLSYGNLNREQRIALYSEVETLHSFWSMINRTRRIDIEDFCIRHANTLRTNLTPIQKNLHDNLLDFEASALRILHPTVPEKFMMNTIMRQAASCVFGLAPAMDDLINRRLRVYEFETESEDETEKIDLRSFPELLTKAEELKRIAENLPPDDPKFDAFVETIKEKQKYNNNKIIVFSTFRHTQNYLAARLKGIAGLRVAQVNGSVKDDERYDIRERFILPKTDSKAIDIMLFTEVGSEGIDYQFCDTMVNYDLPWNPMRIEQRIGRIDRRGQKSEAVTIHNCITQDTIDQEIFDRCLTRIGVFKESLGDCEEILGKIADEIQKIAYNPQLTEEEKTLKFEKLADNQIAKIQELRRLENDERELFGVDISGFTKAVEQAENPWLAPEAVKRLVIGYFQKRLKSIKPYIVGERLTLTSAEKAELLEDYNKVDGRKDNSWAKFLRSGNTSVKTVFSQDEAKDPSTLFINALHPLVKQSAKAYNEDGEVRIAFKAAAGDIAPGKYPFHLYTWEYTGGSPKTSIVAVCKDSKAQAELPGVLQNAVKIDISFSDYDLQWSELDSLHSQKWEFARQAHIDSFVERIKYRVESLARSAVGRKRIAQSQIDSARKIMSMQLDKATNYENVIQMREREIQKIDADFELRRSKLEKTISQADIHYAKIISGVLIVEE